MADKKLTKEQAHKLYDDLHRAMGHMLTKEGQSGKKQVAGAPASTESASRAAGRSAYTKSAPSAQSTQTQRGSAGKTSPRARLSGNAAAVMAVALLCCAKLTLSAFEMSGIGKVEEAQAVIVRQPAGPRWTKEEAKVLTSLDARRVELEERSTRLEQRESDFATRERELAVRLTELKELAARLKLERDKGEKQKNTQLDQLANVYGSMNPPEAAHLLEQLDIQVSLALIERMPEKRMGQILALMNPQRALELTNLLSQTKRS